MKFVKTVDQIAFGNHKLKNFGLASLLIGAAATVAGVLTIDASETNFMRRMMKAKRLCRVGTIHSWRLLQTNN